MTVIGVTSLCRRGYVAAHRGYIAPSRGYVAHHLCNSLSALFFWALFRLLPFFYLLSTSRPLWTSQTLRREGPGRSGLQRALVCGSRPPNRNIPQTSAVRAIGSPGYGVVCPAGSRVLPDRPLPARRLRRFPTWRGEEPLASQRGKGFAARGCQHGERLWLECILERPVPPLVDLSLGAKARQGRVRPGGRIRGEPVGGCGTPANEPALSTGGRGNDDSGSTQRVCGQRSLSPKPNGTGHA
jgi:hypothetical protein